MVNYSIMLHLLGRVNLAETESWCMMSIYIDTDGHLCVEPVLGGSIGINMPPRLSAELVMFADWYAMLEE